MSIMKNIMQGTVYLHMHSLERGEFFSLRLEFHCTDGINYNTLIIFLDIFFSHSIHSVRPRGRSSQSSKCWEHWQDQSDSGLGWCWISFLGTCAKRWDKMFQHKFVLPKYNVKNIQDEETMALPLGGQIFFECPKGLIFHKNWWTMPEFGMFCEVIITPKYRACYYPHVF